jgi:hypothetical protein
MYCICCNKNKVKPLLSGNIQEEDILWDKKNKRDSEFVNINSGMINDGIIYLIDAGYGSKHDGDQFLIAICDQCITEKVNDATILYFGNYIYPEDSFIEKEKNNSKKRYRRRKNLDNLT